MRTTMCLSRTGGMLLFLGLAAFFAIGPALAQVPVVADVAKNPAEVPPSSNGDVIVDLEAVEVVAELAPGTPAWVWAFALMGGKPTVPGPMIRVQGGNSVTINLCNRLGTSNPTTSICTRPRGPAAGRP